MKLVLLAFLALATPAPEALYHYRAEVVSVYDGDTVTTNLDLGMNVWIRKAKLRLYGINAPELRGEEKERGKVARDFLRGLLENREVIVETVKDKKGKYGRWLATLWVKGKGKWCPQDQWCDANKYMVSSGNAVFKEY